ncbi:MAG: S10 family peptidase [Phenylobacterium sp.]
MRRRQASTALGAVLALSVSTVALAQPAPRLAVTHHVGHFNGQTVPYMATVAETFLHDAQGKPTASVITIAYTREGVGDPAGRPVLFAFNGGPGASSSPTHTQALGPMIRGEGSFADRSEQALHENPHSPLDAVDLVFIDPVGTGFSRPLPGVDPKPYYSVTGDALAVKGVIQDWLREHHREGSPRYILGESYGTTRAAAIIKNGKDLRVEGVMLVALVGGTPGREMPYVASLPTMAAGAWYHQKIDRRGRSVEQVFDEALEFARTEYVTALIKGGSLPPTEKRRIAARMSALIGLPAEFIEQHDLRISKNDWMFNVLKDKALRTGLLDVTVTAPLEPGQDGAIDDPALGVVPKRAAGAPAGPPPTPDKIGPVPSPAVGTYLTNDLKFPSTDTYIGVNFSVNAQWNYESRSNDFEALAAAMRADPKLRLFWAAGYYDLTTPAYAARYTLDQAGVPASQLSANYFPGPHGVYAGEANLKRFDDAVRAFVTARGPEGSR